MTDGNDERFAGLCRELDAYLCQAAGSEKQREKYDKYNKTDDIHDVVLAVCGGVPAGCGSFKKYDETTAEIKRVFVKERYRRRGFARQIMRALEKSAAEKGYTRLILETGKPLEAAMKLYAALGYRVTDNYGQYADMPESVCMEKLL